MRVDGTQIVQHHQGTAGTDGKHTLQDTVIEAQLHQFEQHLRHLDGRTYKGTTQRNKKCGLKGALRNIVCQRRGTVAAGVKAETHRIARWPQVHHTKRARVRGPAKTKHRDSIR